MRNVTVAATQMACTWDREETLERAAGLVEEAAQKGANIVLLQELFETPYFCQQERTEYLKLATTVEENPAIAFFQKMAKQKELVIPVSFYEKAGNTAFNSVAVIDADGSIPGVYRKTHIPHSLLYEEKFYFTPGDTGFRAWKTQFGTIGVGICWDQWFPETARSMALLGAELLLYPTAIGSEPILECDSMPHWQRCMQGHAAANLMPVIAANRIGTEAVLPCPENGGQRSELCFYGSSFLTDETGALLQCAPRDAEAVLLQTYDLDALLESRSSWGLFRDRRPEYYGAITHRAQDSLTR